jgi:hypothetical protein
MVKAHRNVRVSIMFQHSVMVLKPQQFTVEISLVFVLVIVEKLSYWYWDLLKDNVLCYVRLPSTN